MISETTANQIAGLHLRPERPLVICDVDEVVVHFTRDFEDFLARRGLWLDTSIMLFSGNVRDQKTLALRPQMQSGNLVCCGFTNH